MRDIKKCVKRLVAKYGTRDPERLAKEFNIIVKYKDYGNFTKGYYIKLVRNKFIVVNINLSHEEQQVVLAHELGHALLHNTYNIYFIRECTLFPIGRFEIEANKFAAELLIDDDEIYKDLSIPEMSQWLGVPEELVKYKLDIY